MKRTTTILFVVSVMTLTVLVFALAGCKAKADAQKPVTVKMVPVDVKTPEAPAAKSAVSKTDAPSKDADVVHFAVLKIENSAPAVDKKSEPAKSDPKRAMELPLWLVGGLCGSLCGTVIALLIVLFWRPSKK